MAEPVGPVRPALQPARPGPVGEAQAGRIGGSGAGRGRRTDGSACGRVPRCLRDLRPGKRQGRLHGAVRVPQPLDPAQGLPCRGSVRAVVDRPRRDRAAAPRRVGGHRQPVPGARRNAAAGDRRVHRARGGSRGNSPANGVDEHVDRCGGMARRLGAGPVARGDLGGRGPDRPAPFRGRWHRRRHSGVVGVAVGVVPGGDERVATARRGGPSHGRRSGRNPEPNAPAWAVALDRDTGRLGFRAPGWCRPIAIELSQSRGCGSGHRSARRGEGQPRAGQ